MSDLLIIDGDYLSHRAEHATGHLRNTDARTGVVFGYIAQLGKLAELFPDRTFVHCFNHGKNRRFKLFPLYLAQRKKRREKEEKAMSREAAEEAAFRWSEFDRQRKELQHTILRELGYSNVFFADGFESDDVMARVAYANAKGSNVIVTSDRDLWQCISLRTSVYDPVADTEHTQESVREAYLLDPSQWWKVKVLAGCNTDSVPGIRGVGEKSAISYLNGRLDGWRAEACRAFIGTPAFKRNVKLIRLPMDGTPHFEVRPDNVTPSKRRVVAQQLGFRKI